MFIFSESRLRLMKVHVSTWTDQQGHQALGMVQDRLLSPGTWFWHILYRNDGIEYTLRSEIRWRCYRNNNFIAAKMMISDKPLDFWVLSNVETCLKKRPYGVWTQALCGLPACLGHEAVFSSIAQAHCICIAEDAPWSHTRRHGPVQDSYGAQCQAISRRTSNIGHLQLQSLLVTSTHVNPCQPMTAKNFLFFNS